MNHKVFPFRLVTLLALLTIFGSAFAQNPCRSNQYVQATIINGDKTVCALKSTINSWENQGFAILTSKITDPSQETLAENTTTLLEVCSSNHVKVSLTNDTSTFLCN